MKRMWTWAVPALALSMGTGCDKKEEATPEAAAEAPAEGAEKAPGKAADKGADKAEDKAKKADAKVSHAKAYEHLPEGCTAVMTFDLKGASSDKNVAEHIIKPIDENFARLIKEPKEEEKEGQEALQLLGIHSATQFHSVGVCIGKFDMKKGEPESFGGVITGEIGIASGWLDVAAKFTSKGKEGKMSRMTIGGVDALKDNEDGVIMAQAGDGAIAFSNDEKLLEKMLKPSDAYKKYDLHLDHHFSLTVSEKLANELMHEGGKGSPLENLHPGEFTISGSVDGTFKGHILMPSEKEAVDAAKSLTMLVGQMAQSPDPMAKQVLGGMKFSNEKEDLKIDVTLPKEMVEAGIAQMGKDIAKDLAEDSEEKK